MWNKNWCLVITKLAMQDQLKVLYMVLYGRTNSLLQYFCMMPTIITICSYTTNATKYSSTSRLLPLVFFDDKWSPKPLLNLWFSFQNGTNNFSSGECKGHLLLKWKTAKGDTLRCPLYRWLTESLFAGIWEWYSCRVWYWKPCCLAHIFRFLLVTWFFTLWLCGN